MSGECSLSSTISKPAIAPQSSKTDSVRIIQAKGGPFVEIQESDILAKIAKPPPQPSSA